MGGGCGQVWQGGMSEKGGLVVFVILQARSNPAVFCMRLAAPHTSTTPQTLQWTRSVRPRWPYLRAARK